MLESLRAQGVDVPEVGEKRPRPGTRIRPNKKKDQLQHSESQEEQVKDDVQIPTTNENVVESTEKKEEAPVVEKIKDSWDASSEDEDEETKKVEEAVTKEESEAESVEDESEEDSEDVDDESDSDNKSDGDTKTDAEAKREKAWERILVSR